MLLHCLESSQSRAVFDSICSGSSLGFLFNKPNLITTDFQVGQCKGAVIKVSVICSHHQQITVVGLVIIKIGRINLVVLFGAAIDLIFVGSIEDCICRTAVDQIDRSGTHVIVCLAVRTNLNCTGIFILIGIRIEEESQNVVA